ncbi:MAG: SCO family protein [Sandarakinorhabdus sp.]|nr:SCO family protein [Sandarakinorhabdus sp.]
MNKRVVWITLALAVVLAGGLGWLRFTAPPLGNLAGSSLGGAFALTDQHGAPVTEKSFAGQFRLMYFGYTFCPDVCPNDVGYISHGLADYEKARPTRGARVTPIFITVDPERDDVAAMKAFTGAFHPRLVGLTGSLQATRAVQKAYGIYAKKVPTSDPANYLVDHYAVIYLFGPDGAPIAFLPHGSTAADVTAMLETYVR